MKNKVLVLGNTGMLGHMVEKVLSKDEGLEIFCTHRRDANDPFYFNAESGLQNLHTISDKNSGFDYFINCIGITNNKIDERDTLSVLRAIKINAVFPHELADFAEKRDIRVIHISTDGVFSGNAERCDESALSDCTDIYGKTKSLGEAVNDHFLNIRCSIIGPSPFKKEGLLEWFLSQADNAVISGYTNHFWNGVSTLQFGELCLNIIKGNNFDTLRKESSVFHFSPNDVVSKYELLNLMKTVYKKQIDIIPTEHGGGKIRRILKSRLKMLYKIYTKETSVENMIMDLKQISE